MKALDRDLKAIIHRAEELIRFSKLYEDGILTASELEAKIMDLYGITPEDLGPEFFYIKSHC